MKRLFSLLLCLCMVVTFVACGEKKNNNENKVDLEYYAKLGQIPELEYSLGADVDETEEKLSGLLPEEGTHPGDDTHNHEQTEFYFERREGDNNILLDNGIAGYYVNKNNKKKGISYIVNYDTSFGSEIGTVSIEIKNALKGYKLEEEDVSEDNAFFATYISNGTVLKTTVNDVVFMFVFQENELFATAIYNNNWTF